MPSTTFDPSTDMHSLSGKTILVTGGTGGLGAASVAEFAKNSPDHIIFTGRNQKNADALIARLNKSSPGAKLTFLSCDISSFASVKQAADKLPALTTRLDILMLNAGIMATPPAVSADGYEIQFATNHLGHALLVKLLLPVLLSTAEQPSADVRIVNMTSYAYTTAPSMGIDFNTLKSDQESLGNLFVPGRRWSRYGQSKLAQLHYSHQLAKHYPQLTSVSVHPGIVYGTNLFEGLPLMTKLPVMLISHGKTIPVEKGHWNQCWASTVPKGELENGAYYEPMGRLVIPTTRQGTDVKLAERLWEWTQEELAGC